MKKNISPLGSGGRNNIPSVEALTYLFQLSSSISYQDLIDQCRSGFGQQHTLSSLGFQLPKLEPSGFCAKEHCVPGQSSFRHQYNNLAYMLWEKHGEICPVSSPALEHKKRSIWMLLGKRKQKLLLTICTCVLSIYMGWHYNCKNNQCGCFLIKGNKSFYWQNIFLFFPFIWSGITSLLIYHQSKKWSQEDR